MNTGSGLEKNATHGNDQPEKCCLGLVRRAVAEMRAQRPILLPLLAMNFTWFAKLAITTLFLGRLGELPLSGATLGFTFANVTGFSVLTGLCYAVEPICGQAFGAKNFKLLHKTLVMAASMLLLVSIPIAILWLKIDDILIHFGQQKDVSIVAKEYVLFLLPNLLITSLLCPLKIYLTAQNVTVPIMLSTALAVALHVPANVVLSKTMGVRGVASAFWITDFVILVLLSVYVLALENGKGGKWKEGGWWDQSRRDWVNLVKLAGPCCLTTCLEWWCFEILILLTGNLPDAKKSLAIIAIVLNFDYLLFSAMLSLSTTASIRVSNELGANRPSAAHTSALTSLTIATISGLLGGSATLACREFWGALFTRDRAIVLGVRRMMVIAGVMEVVNFPVVVLGGVVRGTARPWLGTYANVCGFYLLALPLGVVLGFKVKLGLKGLLWGFVVGVVVCLVVLLVFVWRINWVDEAKKAQILASCDNGDGDNDDDDDHN